MSTNVAYNQNIKVPPMEVVILPATKSITKEETKRKKLRVAAYCRVSTDDEEQLTSYEAQIAYYTQKIDSNENWTSAGIWADEGITGVMAKKRPKFLEMIEMCRKGKIDIVLTKSISRFSRNITDCIKYIRELKSMGIGVCFEKENINTNDMTSEMILALHSVFAQAESESISNNVKLGKRFGYKSGRVPMQYGMILGYKKGEDGEPEIVPDEAKTVELIYTKFLDGYSMDRIKQILEEGKYLTVKGNTKWSKATIRNILTNEKYKGDVLMQKSYIVDLFTKETRKNTGELPMYLAKNHHTPIIEPAVFDRVQLEIAKRNNLRTTSEKCITKRAKYSSRYALTGIVMCNECGSKYRRTTWTSRGKKRTVWRCMNRLEHGTKYCKVSPTILEDALQNAVLSAINNMLDSKEKLKALLSGSIAEILSAPDSQKQIMELNNQIELMNAEVMDIVTKGVDNRDSREEIEEMCKAHYEKISEMQTMLAEAKVKGQMETVQNGQLHDIYNHVSKISGKMQDYDDDIVRLMVTGVRIIDETKITVTLFDTIAIEVEL